MMDRLLTYRIKKELPLTLLFTAVLLAIWGVILLFVEKDGFSIAFDIMIFNLVLITFRPGEFFGQYMNLGFSRKKFYKSQIAMIFIQSVLLAVFRTAVQYLFYDGYVKMFMEDTNHTLDMYHRVSVPELFITNVLIFSVFLMVGTLSVASGVRFLAMGQNADVTLQLRVRLANRGNRGKGGFNKFVRMLLKPMGFLLMLLLVVGFEIATIMFYWFQMLYAFRYRVAIMAGIMVVFVIMYVVGRCLYKPKFV